ncbi:hypothetical protein FJZ21_02280 [Candidatus Pacearchaeota archaeon]|nr:hypothetical protein [Candidatus Pacearchaeota archaeon]
MTKEEREEPIFTDQDYVDRGYGNVLRGGAFQRAYAYATYLRDQISDLDAPIGNSEAEIRFRKFLHAFPSEDQRDMQEQWQVRALFRGEDVDFDILR